MATLVLLLGTNLGNKKQNLANATELLEEAVGKLVKKSSVFQTPPWGFESGNEFYNQVIILETKLPAQEALQQCLYVENELGRVRNNSIDGYQDRLIDVDILFYDSLVLETKNLVIPHPHLQNRMFTLVPLCELMPGFIHPVLKKPVSDLQQACSDSVKVTRV